MLTVTPIQTTVVDWDTWRLICNETYRYNPTAGLDKAGININDPAAFCGSLSFDNNPHLILRDGERSYMLKHSLLTVAVVCEPFITQLIQNLPLTVTVQKTFSNDLLIVSGSIYDYRTLILMSMNANSPFEIRLLLNKIYLILGKTNFRSLFQNLAKRELSDQTFTLS
jgi:hypothetical protein